MAPLIAALLKAGLPLLANAALAKGKEYIEEKAGVKLTENLTEPEYLKLKQFELENERDRSATNRTDRSTVHGRVCQENETSLSQEKRIRHSWVLCFDGRYLPCGE
jgi:hypothetical protein